MWPHYRRPGNPDQPTLVLLHGYGADEHDLVPIADELSRDYEVISLAAPGTTPYGGRAWFAIDFTADESRRYDLGEAVGAARGVSAALGEMLEGKRWLLAGFSQGAMISAAVARGEVPGLLGVALMSGAYLPGVVEGPVSPVPFLVQHGVMDPVVSFDRGRELADQLVQDGANVDFRSYRMAHQISGESLNDLDAFFLRCAEARGLS